MASYFTSRFTIFRLPTILVKHMKNVSTLQRSSGRLSPQQRYCYSTKVPKSTKDSPVVPTGNKILSDSRNEYLTKLPETKEEAIMFVGMLRHHLAEKEKQIRYMKPLLSIRRKIETYEVLLAPELTQRDPDSFFNLDHIIHSRNFMEFHEAKWKVIIAKDDSSVSRLKDLINNSKIVSEDVFCRIMGSFFSFACGNIPSLPLSSYSPEEMEVILRDHYEIYDPMTISCVTDVLMHL